MGEFELNSVLVIEIRKKYKKIFALHVIQLKMIFFCSFRILEIRISIITIVIIMSEGNNSDVL